ncbi:unnamed protein product [Blepharisma stoltei]|uniref:POPDC1-3 domain-containing protein n=1 Tax=Blepharisma stoltei TaxID=1481888 RepID=A0AAU9JMW7_9CILI|nr:unnamed protein product [Blepharisma stoltei]
MPEVLPANMWAYQIANACYFLSYVQWNQVYLRFVLTVGCIFFVIWGFLGLDNQVDIIIWNFGQACINLIHWILMVRKKIVFNFGDPAEGLYQNVFKNVYSRYEFKLLLHRCIKIVEYKSASSQILKAGNDFDTIAILGVVHPDTKVQLKVETPGSEAVVSENMESYSWLGVIDYMNLLEGKKESRDYEQICNISVTITDIVQPLNVFKIDIKKMEKLFRIQTHGMAIQNGMYAKMLDFVGSFIVSLDLEFIEAKRNYFSVMNDNDNEE